MVWPKCAPLPRARLRTESTMYVTGWCPAIAFRTPGIVLTGTNALDTNVNGTSISDIPCAAWALPAKRPSVMKIHSNANANKTMSRNARIPAETEPPRRKPVAKPMIVMIVSPQI